MTRAAASRGPSRSLVSLLLSWAGRYASRPLAAVAIVTATGAWIIVSVVAGFPARWETIFQTGVAALTLAMVFVIQYSQARHQRATQRKLDEILLAMPGTDNALLTLEFSGAELDPSDAQQVAATAAVELEASRRDPYRQLSRVFHLVGRKGPN